MQVAERSVRDAVTRQVDGVRGDTPSVKLGLQCRPAPGTVPGTMDKHNGHLSNQSIGHAYIIAR